MLLLLESLVAWKPIQGFVPLLKWHSVSKTRTVRGSDYSPAIELSEQKDKLVTATGDIEKYSEKQANKVWLNSVDWVLKILSGNEILTPIKGRNSVANLRNLTLYNPNLDIINVNVYTKFG